jgi:hypothetical protein
MPMSICRYEGGAWANGEPCGMDAPRGQRCDWHTAGAAAALAVAVSMGMVEQAEGRLLGDPPAGHHRMLAQAAIARMVALQADPANDAELLRLLRLVAEDYRHLWAYWDLVTAPGTAGDADARGARPPGRSTRRGELGLRLAAACRHAALDAYRYTPGKTWPFPMIRHRPDCEERDSGPDRTCDCPSLYDWEVDDRPSDDEAAA